MNASAQKYLRIERDTDEIVSVTMDDPERSVNVLNDQFIAEFSALLDALEQDSERNRGVILTSAKNTFFAGADVHEMLALERDDVARWFEKVERIKRLQRRLERLATPVVAAINGSALGAGYELCLACHHRIVIDAASIRVGLPEVTLGLMPGGGGVVRLVRLLGLRKALPLLLDGTTLDPRSAHARGLVDAIVADSPALIAQAREWLLGSRLAGAAWDREEFRFPGGGLGDPGVAAFATLAGAELQSRKKGLYPAAKSILSVAVESMRVDVDTAERIESRYFVGLAGTAVMRNMTTSFLQTGKLKRGESRPRNLPKTSTSRLGIVGAGMMGAGIAWSAAAAGIEVNLLDISLDKAERGKAYSKAVAEKLASQGRLPAMEVATILRRITPTDRFDALKDCDLVIEAVFEDRILKADVTRQLAAILHPDAVIASNTSTLPISELALASANPANFIGLHFFSPVDRMPLLEIICGSSTSESTLARGYDFGLQIGKTPIVVNDSRGFFTSRVYESFCDEGAWLLADGVAPALIDNLAQQVGMPAGPLAAVDAVSQQLVLAVKTSVRDDLRAQGLPYPLEALPPYQWLYRMVNEFGRRGKAYGAGYFEYPKDGPKFFWPKLRELQPQGKPRVSHDDIKDRILYRQAIEAVRCLEEGVLRTVIDANVGSMLGIGFPPWTGGQLQFINARGVSTFSTRAATLADRYGERFAPPQLLIDKARRNETFV